MFSMRTSVTQGSALINVFPDQFAQLYDLLCKSVLVLKSATPRTIDAGEAGVADRLMTV
jgi:hypothetical protein